MKENTVKILLSTTVLVSLASSGYFTFLYQPSEAENTESTTTHKASSETSSQTTTHTNSVSSTTTNSTLKDGTYTGKVISTNRGNFQLSITVSNGKMTAIDMIKTSSGGQSESINANAIPKYTKEALDLQSSEITLISGATETYKGFTGSLQDAINQAL